MRGGNIALKNIFTFDKYTLQVLEDQKFSLIKEIQEIPYVPAKEFPQEYFIDVYYVLYFLSLFFKTKVQILEMAIENKRLFVKFVTDKDLEILEESEFDKAFEKMLSMRKELLMAYLNSCSAFHSTLLLANSNYSVAFVLLVIAIESLSNTYYSEGFRQTKFKRFFINFVPENKRFLPSELRYVDKKLTKEETNALFEKLIGSVYGRVRSGFVHFAKESPKASMVADRLQLAYIKTYKSDETDLPKHKEREELNPSFGWFKRLVEEALLNFLFSQEIKEHNDIHSLLLERFVTRIKVRKPIKLGERITPENVYLQ